jgi:two-component system alkaline phosphatase synthesis response regulator PhoP
MFKQICVVEDDADILELLEFNLRRQGYEVTTYNEGTKAYEGITNILPDLVILDLSLPGLTGMEICKYLRNNQRTSHIPIIILTARTDESDRREGLKQGADKFITKPFSIKEILANIIELDSAGRQT